MSLKFALLGSILFAIQRSEGSMNCSLLPNQYAALKVLYASLGGDYWSYGASLNQTVVPWSFQAYNNRANPCIEGWSGILCNNCTSIEPTTSINSLNFSFFGLKGDLAADPAHALRNLTTLEALDFTNNSLTGSVPGWAFSAMKNLSNLHFSYNFFSGSLPDLSSLNASLRALFLDDNFFTGSVPLSLMTLTSVEFLYLDYNSLTGTVPSSIGIDLSNLVFLYLKKNSFSGSIPSSIGMLSKLLYFAASDNKFSGTIDVLSTLPQLQYFSVKNNLLTGSIPEAISIATNLTHFRIRTNQITGSIPYGMSKLDQLVVFAAGVNYLEGSIEQVFTSKMTRLLAIDLVQNTLTGTIPSELFTLPLIQTMALSINCFHGSLPANLCEAQTLEALLLDGLSSGATCREYLLGGLVSSYVPRNYLVGRLPTCMFQLPNITIVHLSGNGIGCDFPQVSKLGQNLEHLSISYNQLRGTIPAVVQQNGFALLDLSHNKITGTIELMSNLAWPSNQSSMENSIRLQVNRLSGDIPGQISAVYSKMQILTGNLFQCTQASIPKADEDAHSYICGSDSLNTAVLTALVVFSGISLWLAAYFIYFRFFREPTEDNRMSSSGKHFTFETRMSWVVHDQLERESIQLLISRFTTLDETSRESWISRNAQVAEQRLSSWDKQLTRWNDRFNSYLHTIIEHIVFQTTGMRLFHPKLPYLRKLHRFVKLLHQLRQIFLLLGVASCVILLPVYTALSASHEFSTYTHQYGWLTSSAFMSGTAPAIIVLGIWVIMATIAVWRAVAIKQQLKVEEGEQTLIDESNTEVKGRRKLKSGAYLAYLVKREIYEKDPTWVNYFALTHSFKVTLLCVCLAVVNTALILAMNGFYVYVEISQGANGLEKFLCQVAVALGKMGWNFIILRYLTAAIVFYNGDPSDKKVNLYIGLVAFNNVVAPILATGITDQRCLNSIFFPTDNISSSYTFAECGESIVLLPNGQYAPECTFRFDTLYTNSFDPPFSYSYQCSTAIITNYVPIFTYSYTVFLLWPVVKILLSKMNPVYIPNFIRKMLPGMMWPHSPQELFHKLLSPDMEIVQQLLHLVILLTFGMTNFSLAVLICLSALLSSIVTQAFIVRYLDRTCRPESQSNASVAKSDSTLDSKPTTGVEPAAAAGVTSKIFQKFFRKSSRDSDSRGASETTTASLSTSQSDRGTIDLSESLENACSGYWRRLLNGIKIAFIGACTFYACLIFDVAADVEGWRVALWVPMLCSITPLSLYFLRLFCRKSPSVSHSCLAYCSQRWKLFRDSSVGDGTFGISLSLMRRKGKETNKAHEETVSVQTAPALTEPNPTVIVENPMRSAKALRGEKSSETE